MCYISCNKDFVVVGCVSFNFKVLFVCDDDKNDKEFHKSVKGYNSV